MGLGLIFANIRDLLGQLRWFLQRFKISMPIKVKIIFLFSQDRVLVDRKRFQSDSTVGKVRDWLG